MIPFLNIKAQYTSIKDEIDAAVLSVLASGQYALASDIWRSSPMRFVSSLRR